MVKRYNRLLVALHVADRCLARHRRLPAGLLLRFETGLIPVTKGYPPLRAVPRRAAVRRPRSCRSAFHLQGLYRLRRGRSRIDDFFDVLVGSILAVVLGVVGTLYFQAYYVTDALKEPRHLRGLAARLGRSSSSARSSSRYPRARVRPRGRWNAAGGRASACERVLIAGAGELGRMVADRMLEHRELGYVVVGFVDDRAGGDHLGYRGLPLLGTLAETRRRSPCARASTSSTSRCRSTST